MSVLFGAWNLDGKPVEADMVSAADKMLVPYAPDGRGHYSAEGIIVVHHAFCTSSESRREKQPFVSASGAVITWDGRLDNRDELIDTTRGTLTNNSTDLEIVAGCFDLWGTNCFAKLLGDWAIAIWDQRQRHLVLAKDFVGVRPLYYTVEDRQATWSTVLDPLVLLSAKRFTIDEAYVAGWLAMYPAANRTPYVGISAVTPSSFVTVSARGVRVEKYWDFDPTKRITYPCDREYEEHFRSAFGEAVRRRLRSDHPICAELSGGMDSNSITFMANRIAGCSSDIPEIHTLSYYDDSEPHANERAFFTKAENRLGRSGCHIDLANVDMFKFAENEFIALPGSMSGRPKDFASQQTEFFKSRNIKVVLSGIGGDEMAGGVPSPDPELQDLMVQFQLRKLAHKLKLWALSKRKPWFHLLGSAIRGFLPGPFIPQPTHLRPPRWLQLDYVRRQQDVLTGFNRRVHLRGALPSLQTNLDSLETLRRQFGTRGLSSEPAIEMRYPFLDRTLLEFIFAIPREQVLLPGYRRSLMRRALAGIVPAEILERRRKAYASRGPRVAISRERERLSCLSHTMKSAQLGMVDEDVFRDTLIAVQNSDQIPLASLGRVIVLEAWLRLLASQGVLLGPQTISDTKRTGSLAASKPSPAS